MVISYQKFLALVQQGDDDVTHVGLMILSSYSNSWDWVYN